MPSSTGADNGTIVADVAGLELTYHGNSISPANPLLPGDSAAGSIGVTGMTAGTTYQVTVIITFGDGMHAVETLDITAQL